PAKCIWLFEYIWWWGIAELLHFRNGNYALYYSINYYATATNGRCTEIYRVEKARGNGPEKTCPSDPLWYSRSSVCSGDCNVHRLQRNGWRCVNSCAKCWEFFDYRCRIDQC